MSKLGQNFLVDLSVRDEIIRSAGVDSGDLVVEIGPGRGMLTRPLAERAGGLIAIEVDPELAGSLERVFAGSSHVQVVHADILECDLGRLVRECCSGVKTYSRVLAVSNLPYCITTPILHRLFAEAPIFSSFVLMVQLEVAQKLVAAPGTSAYGPLSVRAQYATAPRILFTVEPAAFDPPPAVQSAVVRMDVWSTPPVEADPSQLVAMVGAGFRLRRKTLRNSLLGSSLFGGDSRAVDDVLSQAGIDGRRRAETLSLEEFAAIARARGVCKASDG
ncbi:MAG: 16S rRNA (adenine(1518)-N(6)/adenine(1519)-N(6))-dimethyltransferase RsmA [Clostridia bacterium]|nr:16S rRNA (adenine(1518)-N(6)/adenine(1519)-N(6))-dimethyltransferase RsmA [Clostridia bacterium]